VTVVLTTRGERFAHAVRTAVRGLFWTAAAVLALTAVAAVATAVQHLTGGVS
jgi:ribonucleotide reductase alpha subunit